MSERGRSFSASSKCSSDGGPPSAAGRRLTLCVVGSGGVGKSSLTCRYLQGDFPEVSQP